MKSFFKLFILLLLCSYGTIAQEKAVYTTDNNMQLHQYIELYEDKGSSMTVEEALHSTQFQKNKKEVPNIEVTKSSIWVRFTVENKTADSNLVLQLAYATIDSVNFFVADEVGNVLDAVHTGEYVSVYQRKYEHQDYFFDLRIPAGQTRKVLLKVNSSEQFQLPLSINTVSGVTKDIANKDFIFGIYAGLIMVMFLYNLFIFFTVRDRSYLYYVLYILCVGLTQACLEGYSARFLYPNSALLPNLMMVVIPASSGMSALAFLNEFLQVRSFAPRLQKVLMLFFGVYVFCIILGIIKEYHLAAQVLQINVMLLAVAVLITGSFIASKGYRPAKYFMLAWTVFLASVIVFVLKNFNVLPYNVFTYYALQIGSGLEVILLSFALADKINTFRKEKEESQAQAFLALQENARIVSEQNVMLETKVAERTLELNESNQELSKTLVELKEAEMQLVESEKMASLGQLTAGIAHEINNPINFVTSNVKPLQRDIDMILDVLAKVEELTYAEIAPDEKKRQIDALKQDYDFDYLKTEIGYLLKGINEGSSRTAEIVKGLRIFSRLDEDDLKKADINEGLDSTTIIVNNLLDNKIEIVKEYDSLPLVDCYPGKLNQVFLNIITNGIHALKSKFQDQKGGVVTISTRRSNDDKVIISIKDNGTGMTEQTKKKLFEPFFTTKDVGEGTGLGLSIAYNTIKKHNGTITVESEIGVGTEFIIEIPIAQ